MAEIFKPETFPFEKRYKYAHMKPADIELWERFIKEFPEMYDSVQYDVPVGEGPMFDTLITEETGAHDERLYKRKIDVVGFKKDEIDIIEVKPKAGSSAIGQVLMYRNLYTKDYKPPKYPKCVIITDTISNDVADFATEAEVQMVVV